MTCLDNLWRSLVRVPAGVFATVEKELLSKLFDVSVQDGAHFDTKVLGINNGRSHDDWGRETNINREWSTKSILETCFSGFSWRKFICRWSCSTRPRARRGRTRCRLSGWTTSCRSCSVKNVQVHVKRDCDKNYLIAKGFEPTTSRKRVFLSGHFLL